MQTSHCFFAFNEYFATGEGMTVWIALGGSPEHAEQVFRAHVPAYFQQGMTVARLSDPELADARTTRRFVPDAILELIEGNPPGSTTYFSRLHFNLS